MDIDKLKAAWNAQADECNQWDSLGLDEMVAFAQDIEREACAKVCDTTWNGDADTYEYSIACNDCAEVIRERSNT